MAVPVTDEAWVRQNFAALSDVRHVGTGGQKSVFRAKHPTDGDVVLKAILKPSSDERISREILAVQTVSSLRVPKIFETGTVGQTVWIREQCVTGDSLRARLRKADRLKYADLLRLQEQVLDALHAAEAKKIVHRDVKPDNIMCDVDGSFWLLDFGLARFIEMESLTATGPFGGVGTAGYAPEEQYRNKKKEIDGRADLFALGVTLWESHNGAHPFTVGARDFFEVARRIEGSPPARLAIVGDDGNELSAMIATFMHRRRDYRPSSVKEALDWTRDLIRRRSVSASG
ncbi:MAG: serine/threonine protein kinase [Deltaproteobacteria bacterium]|nr:serine/threonine protein kinase [Deltaproteobacteria bacterium]